MKHLDSVLINLSDYMHVYFNVVSMLVAVVIVLGTN